MNITVTMTAEEFEEFRAWKKEAGRYERELSRIRKAPETIAISLAYAVEPVEGKKGKFKIVDQEHMSDAMNKAEEFLPD